MQAILNSVVPHVAYRKYILDVRIKVILMAFVFERIEDFKQEQYCQQ